MSLRAQHPLSPRPLEVSGDDLDEAGVDSKVMRNGVASRGSCNLTGLDLRLVGPGCQRRRNRFVSARSCRIPFPGKLFEPCSASPSGGPVCMTLGGRFGDPARAAWPPRRWDAGAALRARLASPARVRDVVFKKLAPHFDHGREFGGGGPVARRRGRAAVVSGHLPPPGLRSLATQRQTTQSVCTCICKNVRRVPRISEKAMEATSRGPGGWSTNRERVAAGDQAAAAVPARACGRARLGWS